MGMETVNLSFRYAEQDYVRALRAHYAGRLRLPLDIAAIVGVAVIGAYEWRSGSHGAGIISFCLSGVLALMLVAAFAVIPSIAFRKQLKFRDEYSLSFSPEGIHFQTTHIDSDLKWGMYTWALESGCSMPPPLLQGIVVVGSTRSTKQNFVERSEELQDASQAPTVDGRPSFCCKRFIEELRIVARTSCINIRQQSFVGMERLS